MFNALLCKEPLWATIAFQNSTGEKKTVRKQKTILVVEDNIDCKSIIEYLLRPLSCKINVVISAEAALKYLAKHAGEVYLIISDIDLPGMSGLELISKIKANSNLKRIPIILQSGSSEEELQMGVALGAASYVQKPYSKEALYMAINKLNLKREDQP